MIMLLPRLNKLFTKNKKTIATKTNEYKIDLSHQFLTKIETARHLKIPNGIIFPEIFINSRKETLIAINKNEKRIIKIELFKNPRKNLDITKEFEMLRKLNEKKAISCPTVFELGTIDLENLKCVVGDDYLIKSKEKNIFSYHIQEYLETKSEMPVADLIFTMLEQKSLGFYHGDIKPANIRFDEEKGICYLIDYDQAEELSDNVINMNAKDFLEWCDWHENEKYHGAYNTWRRHFHGLKQIKHISPMLQEGAFNVAFTTPYRRQITTNTENGIYQTIKSPLIYANGIRDVKERTALLNTVEFNINESILDVGCNAGLMCHYFFHRGCNPSGIDMDSNIIIAAKIIANILHVNVNYFALDIDKDELPEKFDTICLFSVFHHTKKLKENGRKIAKNCNRILLECRLNEHGKKPINKNFGKVKWIDTSIWNYSNESELINDLEKIFIGFFVNKKIGNVDKNRMLFEMIKK